MAKEKIIFETEIKANTAGASKVTGFLDDMEDDLKKLSRETDKLTGETNQLKRAQDNHARSADGVTSSYKDFLKLGVAGAFSAIGAGIATVSTLNRNSALDLERTSAVLATSLENATALNTSMIRAGVAVGEGMGQIESMQGRIIDHFEREKEIVKELAALDRQRMDILRDIEKAETDHFERITDLEKEISEVGQAEIAKRLSQRDEALSQLQKEQSKFMDEARRDEQRQTERLSDAWKDRVKQFKRNVIDAMDDLQERGAKARNFKEFQEIQRQGKKRLDQMRRDLGDEQSQFKTTAEREAAARNEAIEDEKRALAEKSIFIEQQATKDLAVIQQKNDDQVASLQERIAEENEAWTEQQSDFKRGLEDLDRQTMEVQQNTGSLAFIMRELGVDMRGPNGEMRDMVDIIFDMKKGLDEMPASARKAAIIADLGWEDLAVWIERGADATESMKFAQENNLVPLTETLDKIHAQNRMLAELQLQLIGTTEQYGFSTIAGDALVWSLGKIAEGGQVVRDILNQLQQIQALVFERIKEGIDVMDEFGESLGLSGVGDLLGSIGGGISSLSPMGAASTALDFFGGGDTSQSLTPVGGNGRGDIILNVSGDVVGVEDVNTVVKQALDAYDGDLYGIGM